jgi:putative hemolysin
MIQSLGLRRLQEVSSSIIANYNFRALKLHKFKAKVQIYSEAGPYILKTATSNDELRQALQLRYQVFHKEFIGRQGATGLDMDEYDFLCDHLIVIEKKTSSVIGTYRLNCTLFSDQFYSENEFQLDAVHKNHSVKTELGRACIDKNFRRGIVISLLWRGIAEHMVATHSQVLLGSASIHTSDPREAALIYRYLIEQKKMHPEMLCPPTESYSMPQFNFWSHYFNQQLTEFEKKEAMNLIPPLFRTYLKVGALIGGQPAWDSDFRCIDFLTILDKEDLNRSLWKKYKLQSGLSID